MTGRGIDQILSRPCDPRLHERYVTSAEDYVRLAETANGPIPRPVDFSYIWGEALAEWQRQQPDFRIVNLETSITRSEAFEPKGINYRMNPENVGCLLAAGIDCCALANNHVLDWGVAGLIETLDVLARHKVRVCGAGRNLAQASAPAVLAAGDGVRLLIFAYAVSSSGTPASWGAQADRPGVNFLPALTDAAVDGIRAQIERVRMPGDIVILSIHWGPNWGYEIPPEQRAFAHALVDRAGVAIVHGHSSHHAKAIEVYRGRLILHGCGDFLNDYEGIRGYEEFRGDLALMYFADVDAGTGALDALELVALRSSRFRLHAASDEETAWLREALQRESAEFGVRFDPAAAHRFRLTTGR